MRFRLASVVFAMAALSAEGAAAQSGPMLYCDPLRVYYPAVPTCPVPWRNVYGPAPTSLPTAAEPSAAYRRGESDWRDLQDWVEKQAGDGRAGADYWAGNRSKPDHKSCEDSARDFSGDKATFLGGCQETKRRLDPIDSKRRSEPDYRLGFNNAAKKLPLQAGPAPEGFRAPPAPHVSSSFTINNRTCLKISEIKIDDAPQDGDIAPGNTATFKITNDHCSHLVQGKSPTGLVWKSNFECKNQFNQDYTANWTGTNQNLPIGTLETGSLIVEGAHNEYIGRIQITSKLDCVSVNQITANRGNCKVTETETSLPAILKFGQTISFYYQCRKLLELNVATDQGEGVYSFDR